MSSEYKFSSKIDKETGRFVIPKRFLRELNWNTLERVDVTLDVVNSRVVITPDSGAQKVCKNCGESLRDDFKYCPYCGKVIKSEE